MFSTLDKKIITILVIVLVLLFLICFAAYEYFNPSKGNVENSVGGANTQAGNIQIEAQGTNGEGMLVVCQDKCGDSVCQEYDPNNPNSLGQICAENKEYCPQDCK